jgi:hypothetical protein
MYTLFYSAMHADSGHYRPCGHEHSTVEHAASCINSAASYVIAVENGRLRGLNPAEEASFRNAMFGKGQAEKPAPGGYQLRLDWLEPQT